MNAQRITIPARVMFTIALVAVAVLLPALLGGCGGAEEPEVIIVTATPTVETMVVVVTATPSPVAQAAPVETAAPGAPTTEAAGETQPQPATTVEAQLGQPQMTVSLDQVLTAQAVLTLSAPQATDTPLPPTDTAVPPTNTPVPPTAVPAATTAPKPTAKPAGSVAQYGVIYSNFDGGSESDANKYTVWVVRGDGSSATKILNTAVMPAYSPNGQKIAYYKAWEGIAVYDLNKKSTVLAVPRNWAEFASFSPDGKQLVFHEWVGNWWSADVSVYIVNVDGSGNRKLTPGERPAWSPKGDQIAYDTCQGSACGIFVIKTNGQGLRQVTSDAGGNAAWSPDGKKIVYNSSKDGDSEIYVINADGSGLKQLTKNNGNDANPAFSPDGNYIFWVSDQNGTAWALRVMRADGSDAKTVRKIGIAPRWQFARIWAGWW